MNFALLRCFAFLIWGYPRKSEVLFMSLYPFHALLGRMKYITRWALMRCVRPESLSEHTADTALLAHALCLIARNITHTGADIRPDTVAAAALYHDAP